MKITWCGCAGILLETKEERFLFDPFVPFRGCENPCSYEDFEGTENIFITHGHFDHLMMIPEFLEEDRKQDVTVYCGPVASDTLSKFVLDTGNIVEVKPGMSLRFGSAKIAVKEGQHAKKGLALTLRTIFSFRLLRYFFSALFIAQIHPKFKEGSQTWIYEIEAEGKRIQLLGSLGLKTDEEYQKGADLLILPFQGSRKLEETALSVVERLQPRRVLLDHFDDAFPPISRSIKTDKFAKMMAEKHPEIQLIKPEAFCSISLNAEE